EGVPGAGRVVRGLPALLSRAPPFVTTRSNRTHTAESLRATFDAPAPFTVGIEEELMLLDPETLDLTPRATDLLERVDADGRFKLELPAAQFEILSPPLRAAPEAAEFLGAARRDLRQSAEGLAKLACSGVHPFADE